MKEKQKKRKLEKKKVRKKIKKKMRKGKIKETKYITIHSITILLLFPQVNVISVKIVFGLFFQ